MVPPEKNYFTMFFPLNLINVPSHSMTLYRNQSMACPKWRVNYPSSVLSHCMVVLLFLEQVSIQTLPATMLAATLNSTSCLPGIQECQWKNNDHKKSTLNNIKKIWNNNINLVHFPIARFPSSKFLATKKPQKLSNCVKFAKEQIKLLKQEFKK